MTAGIHKIYRADRQPFTMVPNQAVRDPEIPPNAFRLLAYLMSHQDGYAITYSQIERETTLKRYAINAAIELLTIKGYLEVRRTKQENGQWGPKDWIIKDPSTADDSTVEPIQSGIAPRGATSGHKKNTSREKQSKEKNTLEEFEEFWSIYPLKKDKRAAERAYSQALKRASQNVIIAGVTRYRDDPNREPRFTKYPATWLNADAWENGPELPRARTRREEAEERAFANARRMKELEAERGI